MKLLLEVKKLTLKIRKILARPELTEEAVTRGGREIFKKFGDTQPLKVDENYEVLKI